MWPHFQIHVKALIYIEILNKQKYPFVIRATSVLCLFLYSRLMSLFVFNVQVKE